MELSLDVGFFCGLSSHPIKRGYHSLSLGTIVWSLYPREGWMAGSIQEAVRLCVTRDRGKKQGARRAKG